MALYVHRDLECKFLASLEQFFLKIPDTFILLMQLKITTEFSILCHSQKVTAKIFMIHLFHMVH